MRIPEWLLRQMEADPKRFIPYAGHVTPETVLLCDNSALAVVHLHGLPFELVAMAARTARRDRINTLLRSLADADRTICLHMVRHLGASEPPQPVGGTPFVQGLMSAYNKAVFADGKVYRNDWFISIVIRQPPTSASRVRRLLDWLPFRGPQALSLSETTRQAVEDVVQIIMSTLVDYQPKRLGLAEVATEAEGVTLPVTEIGTALHLIRTAHLQSIPHTTGSLAAAIYTSPVVVNQRWFDLNLPGLTRYGAMLGFNNYPARPRIGMFNKFLSAPYPCVMSHSFRFRSTGAAVSAMRLIKQQMENSGDAAEDLSDGLKQAMNATASMRTASGLHVFGLAVYADNVVKLDQNVADASQRLSQFGAAAPTRELNVWYNGALESAYYLQLPGCSTFKPRPGTISTLDLADMASLDNFPTGAAKGYWGPSPIRFLTNGLTTYDLITHDEDVGHTGVYGRIGGGKTVLLGIVVAALEPVMGPDGIRLVIDKDQGNKLQVEACGGTYRTLLRNQPSGLAPLVAFVDSPRTRSFFHRLFTWLIQRDGRGSLTQDEDMRLMRGIARQLQMPPHLRSLDGVREFLGYADRENGAGARFERYCAGGSMGWLLDNREHSITVGAGLYGFDFTDLIPMEGQEDDGACSVAASVITHQLAGLMDGRKIACFCDESRFYMEPLKQMIEDYSLTGRKKELMLWLLAQQPEHHTDTAMGMSLVQQMRTKFIFPDASLDADTLQNKLKVSAAAVRMLKTEMTLGNARRFLLWRPNAPAICEFDLGALEQLSILSGRPGTIRLMDRVKTEIGGPPEAVMTEFYHRLANTRKAA
jgi:type IV secretion system protein VirB4